MPTLGEHQLAGLDWAWSAFEHSGVPRSLVAVSKYRSRPGLAVPAATEVARRLPGDLLEGQMIVPVPPDPWRSRRRGFDIAAELAKSLATLRDFQVVAALRRKAGPPHATMGRAERLAAEPRVCATESLPTRIILLDDVVTTGTTLAACAAAARAAGAAEVSALTLTRALPGRGL